MLDNKENNEEIKDTVEAIEKAKDNLEKISEDEHEKELARLRDKYIRDQKSFVLTGYKEGKREREIEIAKEMLKQDIDIAIISKCTGLTEDEIKNLK